VEGLKVLDNYQPKMLAKDFVRTILGYTLGTYFKVKAGSSKIALK
jgi:hypothetical protein